MNKFKLLSAAAIFAAPIPAAYAQQITSSIEGTVSDEAGNPLANATVTVTDTRTGASRTITTGEGGTFSATGLTVGGPYTVTAVAPGFQGQTVENLNTSLQGATSLSFNLTAATTAEEGATIVVTGQRANVQLRNIGPGTAYGSAVLENTPSFNRDIRDIIRLDPRVSLARDDLSNQDRISCLGGNDRGNTFTVDGIVQGDVYGLNDTGFSSRSSTPIPYDAVRESQVQFAPFDVEFGQFTGCAINVVTRSGGNEFHGGAFYEFNNADLRGNSVAGIPLGRIQPDKRWGANLGGPIWRDRIFFFGAYEHQESAQSQDDGPTGGGFSNSIPQVTVQQFNDIAQVLRDVYHIDPGPIVTSRPFTNDRYFGRLDWQITDDHRLELSYQHLEESQVRTDDFFTGASPQVTGLNTFLQSGSRADYYSARLYSNWTQNFSTEFRYSRSDVTDIQDPIGGGEAQSATPIPRIIVGIDNAPLNSSPSGNDATFLAGPGNSRSANDLQTRIEQYKALFNLELGSHHFKLGFEANHVDLFNLFVQNATGTLVFRNLADLQQGLLSPGSTGTTGTFPNNVVLGQTVGAFGNVTPSGDINEAAADFERTIWSAYFQDEWRVNEALNIVAGIRTDWYSGGKPGFNPQFPRRFGINNNTGFGALAPVILPRLGFTYDFEDFIGLGRTQIRGGVGIFSGGDPLVWFGNAFQNDGSTFATANTNNAACASVPKVNGQIDVVVNGQFTGVPTCFRTAASAIAAGSLGATQSIDPDIEAPTVLRANIGLQTDLSLTESGFLSGWRLNLDYIWSRYNNPFTIVDLSQTPDTRRGLAGFTSDGRPIYAPIDPTRAGCAATLLDAGAPPVWANVTTACFNTNVSTGATTDANRVGEYMLTNSDGYTSQIASILLSKNFNRGIFTPGGSVYVNIGYAYTDSHDRRNLFNSTAGSNYGITSAFDRQNPAESRGFYETTHNVSIAATFREKFFGDYATSFGFRLGLQSGRPYSLTFAGSGVFGPTQSGSNNALLYIPTGATDPNISPLSNPGAVAGLVNYLQNKACAQGFEGRTIARNTCTNDSIVDMDLTFSQDIPGPGRLFGVEDSLRLYATFDNFLNFINDEWNVVRRRDFSGSQPVASLGSVTVNGVTYNGIDAQGRYIINGFRGSPVINNENTINNFASVWRIKLGISYRF